MTADCASLVADISPTDRDAVMAYDAHVDTVFGYLSRRVGGQLADDLTADVFRLAIERFDRFDPQLGSPVAWLLGIATNLVRRHWRTEHRRLAALARTARHEPVWGDPLVAVDDHLDASARLERLTDAVARLAHDDRDLLVLTAWHGCSRHEVAEALGIPPGTVGSRLNRIRAALRATEGGR